MCKDKVRAQETTEILCGHFVKLMFFENGKWKLYEINVLVKANEKLFQLLLI